MIRLIFQKVCWSLIHAEPPARTKGNGWKHSIVFFCLVFGISIEKAHIALPPTSGGDSPKIGVYNAGVSDSNSTETYKIIKMRETEAMASGHLSSADQLLYFAYVLTMKTVIRELDHIGQALQDSYGVVGGSIENFELLFNSMYESV